MSNPTDQHDHDGRSRPGGAPVGPAGAESRSTRLPAWLQGVAQSGSIVDTFDCVLEDAGGRPVFSGLAEFIRSSHRGDVFAFVPTADCERDAGLVTYLRIGSDTVAGVELQGTTKTADGHVAIELLCQGLEAP
ncbi:MAG: hypothetical protein AB8G96_06875 [Phycisphaerales bacterium]